MGHKVQITQQPKAVYGPDYLLYIFFKLHLSQLCVWCVMTTEIG